MASTAGTLISEAKKFCRVCFETPFEQFFGFPEDPGKYNVDRGSEEEHRGSQEEQKVKRLMALMNTRATHWWGLPELECIIASLVRNTPIDSDLVFVFHSTGNEDVLSECIEWKGLLNAAKIPCVEVEIENNQHSVYVTRILASLFSDDATWVTVREKLDLLSNNCGNSLCVNLMHTNMWSQAKSARENC